MDRSTETIFIGQLAAAGGSRTLVVHGLGSCVALILFSRSAAVGGLAHVLLPGPQPESDTSLDLPAKYGPSAISALMARLSEMGAKPRDLRAILVGGARMFASEMDLELGVGTRNVDSLRTSLAALRIPLAMELTGGDQGRTVAFDLPECALRVRTLKEGWTSYPLGSTP